MAYDVDLDEGIIEGNQKMPLCEIQQLLFWVSEMRKHKKKEKKYFSSRILHLAKM